MICQTPTAVITEHRTKSKPWTLLSVVCKRVNQPTRQNRNTPFNFKCYNLRKTMGHKPWIKRQQKNFQNDGFALEHTQSYFQDHLTLRMEFGVSSLQTLKKDNFKEHFMTALKCHVHCMCRLWYADKWTGTHTDGWLFFRFQKLSPLWTIRSYGYF